MKNKRLWLLLLGLILLLGGFLRLYRLEETLIFQGDQGRDAIVVKQILKDGDLTLLGPVTSVGNMYLGPFYYYFMLPFLAISYPSPVGPAYGVALVSILTIVVMYLVGKEAFNRWTGLIAAFLLAINTVAVEYGRFSWNPNIAPILTLGIFWACFTALDKKRYEYLVLASVLFGILTQSHYMALLMGGVIAISIGFGWFWDVEGRKKLVKYSVISLFAYAVTWLPLIIFDMRNNFLISSGFAEFLSRHEEQVQGGQRIWRFVQEFDGRSHRILAQLNQSPNGLSDRIIAYGSIVILGMLLYFKKLKLRKNAGLTLLLGWLLAGIVGSSLYSDTVFDHYLLFVLPAVMLFFGVLLERLSSWHVSGVLISSLLIGLYLFVNISTDIELINSSSPNPKHFQRLVQEMQTHMLEGSYNLALITESKDYRGMNYRYFLETGDNPPKGFEDYDNLDWLMIIDELRVENPFDWGIYEIQQPGLTRVVDIIEINNGPRVYIVSGEE